MNKIVQAKHIPDGDVVDAVRATSGAETGWSTTGDVVARLAKWPPKVVCAKLGALVRRGVLYGNPYPTLADRGDFEITEQCSECGARLPRPPRIGGRHKMSCSLGATLQLGGDPVRQTVRRRALVER